MSKRHTPGKWDLLQEIIKQPIPMYTLDAERLAAANSLVKQGLVILDNDHKFRARTDKRWIEPGSVPAWTPPRRSQANMHSAQRRRRGR